MNELTAIVGPKPRSPGHGECFVWQREIDGVVVVVDAGGKKSVGSQAASSDPQILVLSHDDKDHIGGAYELISGTHNALDELWVPADWGILIEQIASNDPNALPVINEDSIDVEDLAEMIVAGISDQGAEASGEEISMQVMERAEGVLAAWAVLASSNTIDLPTVTFASSKDGPERWYGAKGLAEIVDRVNKRSKVLIKILKAALGRGVHVRFFSIDRALTSSRKEWEVQGKAGVATLANAAEVESSMLGVIPQGVHYAYALTCLTVQNRRALSTLIWADPGSTKNGVVIWSDTDGLWLNALSPRGFSRVVQSLSASSAPHHASSNTAHDRVWQELRCAPLDMPVISAGGQKNQGIRPEYESRSPERCCTWCRPSSGSYQDVKAISSFGGIMTLQNQCLRKHP